MIEREMNGLEMGESVTGEQSGALKLKPILKSGWISYSTIKIRSYALKLRAKT